MTTLYILLTVLILLALANIFFVYKRSTDRAQDQKINQITQQLTGIDQQQDRLRENMDAKLENIHRAGQNQFREAREIIGDITSKSDRLINHVNQKLGDLDKTNQKIVDFSSQLKSLQDILKNPKQRGVLGEFILEQVLGNVLSPETYKMQHTFSDGEIVDAAVYVKEKIIPIDSKFSLENYERVLAATEPTVRAKMEKQFKQDLKLRIDETAKYIRPAEGTTDFAFMFIPSEAIYYDLLVNTVGAVSVNTQNMIEYAFRDKHVIIVSPTSFLAYLQTVLQGLKALEIEENAKHIKKRVEELSRHWNAYDLYMGKLGKTLGTTVSHFNKAYSELGKVDRDVMRITDREKREIQPDTIQKPDSLDNT